DGYEKRARAPARRPCSFHPADARLLQADAEAVEVAVAAGPDEVLLAAPTAAVRRVPGGRVVAAALAVDVPHEGAPFAVARPVAAGGVLVARCRGAVGEGTGEDVVLVRVVPAAVDLLALLGERRLLVEVVLTVEGFEIGGDLDATIVVPGPLTDAV